MATHSSTLAWKIPWMREPGRLQSMASWRVRHDWVTSLSLFTCMHWRRKWHPLQCSCLENPRTKGAWWAAIYGVAQNWTWLMRLSSSSSSRALGCEAGGAGAGHTRQIRVEILSRRLFRPVVATWGPQSLGKLWHSWWDGRVHRHSKHLYVLLLFSYM